MMTVDKLKILQFQILSDSFSLYALACPGGYAINITTCTCMTSVEEILFCEDDQDSVILKVSKCALLSKAFINLLKVWYVGKLQ